MIPFVEFRGILRCGGCLKVFAAVNGRRVVCLLTAEAIREVAAREASDGLGVDRRPDDPVRLFRFHEERFRELVLRNLKWNRGRPARRVAILSLDARRRPEAA